MINPLDFEWLRWAGATILLFMLLFGAFILIRYPLGKHASISRHIASNRVHYLLMAIFLTFGGGLFYAFLSLWLIPTYHLSPLLYALLAVAFIAQLTMSWVPDKSPTTKVGRRFHLIHFTGGAIVAISMMLSLYFVLASFENLPLIGSILAIVSTIFSTLSIMLFILVKKTRQHFLWYESVFILLFALAMFSLIFKI